MFSYIFSTFSILLLLPAMADVYNNSNPIADVDELLINAPFYHGFQTRIEADTLLREKDGTFLVRLVQDDTGEFVYVVSVFWDGKKRHHRIYKTEHGNYYYLDEVPKRTIMELIRFHRNTQKPIDCESGARLRRMVVRSNFALYREQLTIQGTVGHGEFGEVRKGRLKLGIWTTIDVAVKQDMQAIDANDRIQFLREANLMMRLRHRNIVRLFGVVIYSDPVLIVTEFAAGGCLLGRLMNLEEQPTVEERKTYCRHICYGMAYLEGQMVIHRDLAVKNCLLGSHGIVKIADFGLSIRRSDYINPKARVPLRYVPPETLKRAVFSHKTDVWAYGCTMFEIWKCPYEEPYQQIGDNFALRRAILYQGLRLIPPDGMPSRLRELMLLCHATNPEERPTFEEIKRDHFIQERTDFREMASECFNAVQRMLMF